MAGFLYSTSTTPVETTLIVPFFKHLVIPLSAVGFIVLTYLVVVGSSNAVNLTDGLDGLAILPTVMVAAALGIFAYVAGHLYFSKYLEACHMCQARESSWCSAQPWQVQAQASHGLAQQQRCLWALIALALGAALGIVAVIVRQEIILFIMGWRVCCRDILCCSASDVFQIYQEKIWR